MIFSMEDAAAKEMHAAKMSFILNEIKLWLSINYIKNHYVTLTSKNIYKKNSIMLNL